MEEEHVEWEVVKPEPNDGKLTWMLSKGLTMGKRILAAGLLLSSAPLVVPSLFVVSAVGFVCSVPCGVFLASYACTEKLMAKFLPLEYDEEGGIDTLVEIVMENENIGGQGQDLEIVEISVEGANETRPFELVEEVRAIGLGNEYEGVEEGEVESNGSSNGPVQPRVGGNEEVGEVLLQAGSCGTEVANGGEKDVQLPESSTNVDAREIADESGLHLFDHRIALENYVIPQGQIGSGTEISSSTDHDMASCFQVTVPRNVDESKSTTSPWSKPSNDSPNKVQFSEEDLWKQIEAVRAIIGYAKTASSRAKYMEEIKALFLFTGVEPPASAEETCNITEAHDKLRFLMSIIGVK